MSATWRKVLTDANITGGVAAGNTSNLATGQEIAAAIAAASAAAGSGDITEIAPFANGGIIIHEDTDGNGTFTVGTATSGPAQIQVQAGDGISVGSGGVALASTVAGNGLTITNGVINVAGQSGITVTANAIAVNPDDVTIEVASATGDVQVKDGGISFAKLSDATVHISTDNSGNFPSTDTELASARAIGLSFPNVSLLGVANGASTTNYLQLNASGSGIQEVTMGVIDISDDTDFDVNNNSNNQQDVDLTFANSTLTATTPGLATSSNVTFANVNATGNLSVGGDATITGNLTVQEIP